MGFSIGSGIRAAGATILGAGLLLLAGCESPEERKASHYKRGQELLAKGEVVKAALEFKNVLQIDEDHVGALYGISKFQQEKRNWRALTGVLRKVMDLDPKHVNARVDFCRLMLLGNAFDRAIKACADAQKLDAGNSDTYALQAAVYYKLKDYNRSVKLANKALELDNRNIDALIVLAARSLVDGKPKAALAKLDQGLGFDDRNIGLSIFKIRVLEELKDVAGTEKMFQKLIDFYPENRAFRLAFVRYYLSKGRNGDAEAEIRRYAKAKPDDIPVALGVVNFLKTVKGDDAAEAELRALVAAKPGVYQYKLSLGALLWTLKKKDEGRQVTQSVIDSDDEKATTPAKVQMVRMLVDNKELPQAEALVNSILKDDAHNVEALVFRAALSSDRGAFDEAIADLRTALNEAPSSPRILLPLARLHELTGSKDLAEERLSTAAQSNRFQPNVGIPYARFQLRQGKREQAEETLKRVVARAPRNVAALTMLAQILINRQDWVGAQKIADHLAKVKGAEGRSQQILGAVLSGQKKFDESISILREAQSGSPASIQPVVSLVNAYVASGRENDAREFLDDLLKNDPKRVDAHILIGALLIRQGKMDEARERYAMAIKSSPDKPQGYRALTALLMRQKKQDEAFKVLNEGLAKLPDDFALNLFAAGIKENAGDTDGAIAVYEHMIKLRPTSVIIRNNLASLLAETRNDTASMDRAFELARGLRGTAVPQFKDTLGWIYFKRGERDSAIDLLREATKAATPNPMYFYHLGVVYAADELTELARENLTKALELGEKQPFSMAAETREALKKLDQAPKPGTN